MVDVEYVPLYTAEQLAMFKVDPIFDAGFIQSMLGFVGAETPTYKVIELLGYNTVCFNDTPVTPLIYSAVYAANWWRFNSPTRFCDVAGHDISMYNLFPEGTLAYQWDSIVEAQQTMRTRALELVRELKVPVITEAVATGLLKAATDKKTAFKQALDVVDGLFADFDRLFKAEDLHGTAFPTWPEGEFPVSEQVIERNFSVVRSAILADFLRKAFPSIGESVYARGIHAGDSSGPRSECRDLVICAAANVSGMLSRNDCDKMGDDETSSEIVFPTAGVRWTDDPVLCVEELPRSSMLWSRVCFKKADGTKVSPYGPEEDEWSDHGQSDYDFDRACDRGCECDE